MTTNQQISLHPRTVGEILDDSLIILMKLLRPLAPYYLALAAIQTLNQRLNLDFAKGDFSLASTGASFVFVIAALFIGYYTYLLAVLLGAQYWTGSRIDIQLAKTHITFGLLLKLTLLIAWIWGVTAVLFAVLFTPLIVVFATVLGGFGLLIFGLLAAIPALLYFLNRILAAFIYVVEDRRISGALKKSKKLMRHRPKISWYSFKTPVMRLSGIMIVTTALPMMTGFIVIGTLKGSSLAQIILLFAAQVLTSLISYYSNIALLGFYYDLRTRAEGIDLVMSLRKLES